MTEVTDDVAALTKDIAETRDAMGNTVEQLHERLNAGAVKDEVVKQFHQAKAVIGEELKEDLAVAKEAIKAEITETKEHLVDEVEEGLSQAKDAVREATIGKVETMVQKTEDSVKATGRSIANAVQEGAFASAVRLEALAKTAAVQGKVLGEKAVDTYDTSPLAVGAAFLAAGAVVGWAIPMGAKEPAVEDGAGKRLAKRVGKAVKMVGGGKKKSAKGGKGRGRSSARQARA